MLNKKTIIVKFQPDPAVVAWFAKVSVSHSLYSALPGNSGSIPSQDYDIDRSEVEILCNFSNSRAPGVKAYHIEPRVLAYVLRAPQTNPDTQPRSEPALELHSRAVSNVGVMYRSSGPNIGSNFGGGRILKKMLCDI